MIALPLLSWQHQCSVGLRDCEYITKCSVHSLTPKVFTKFLKASNNVQQLPASVVVPASTTVFPSGVTSSCLPKYFTFVPGVGSRTVSVTHATSSNDLAPITAATVNG